MSIVIEPAYRDIDTVRLLFQEYTEMLGVDLGFQNYEQEVLNLPGEYALPDGRLYLATADGQTAGCIALRPFDGPRCEMKRLFVRPAFREMGIGGALVKQIISDAKELGYREVVLDTMTFLGNSIALYRKLGFREIPPYRYNPLPGALFLCLDLASGG